jgi:protein TonB
MRIHLIETGRHHAFHLSSAAWSAGAHGALAASVAVGAWISRLPQKSEAPRVPEKEVVYLLPPLPTAPASVPRDPKPPRQDDGAAGRHAVVNGTLASGHSTRDGDPTDRPTAAAMAAIDSLSRIGHLIFRVAELEHPAERDPFSAAPAYPPELQQSRVEGDVAAEWIVDTLGRADTSSFRVVSATHPGFAQAVRAALPLMHFRPAETYGHRVQQMVRQQFIFRIAYDLQRRDTTPATGPKVPDQTP